MNIYKNHKWTKESVNLFFTENNRNIILLNEIHNIGKPATFKCLICNHIWTIEANSVINKNSGCRVCYFNSKRKWTKNSVNIHLQENNRNILLVGDFDIVSDTSTFKCLICNHVWNACINSVINTGTGCKKCADNALKKWSKDLINVYLQENNRNIILFGDYIDTNSESNFYCTICNHIWIARFSDIHNGTGCRNCYNNNRPTKWSKDLINVYLQENNRNILLIGEFTTVANQSAFECLICNHIWNPTVTDVIHHGTGCPCCSTYGFDVTKPAILYYIKIIPENVFKIGITNRTIEKRFKHELNKIQTIFIENYELGIDAYNKEQKILREFNEYKYSGEPILKYGGNTEIFIKDIFNVIPLAESLDLK